MKDLLMVTEVQIGLTIATAFIVIAVMPVMLKAKLYSCVARFLRSPAVTLSFVLFAAFSVYWGHDAMVVGFSFFAAYTLCMSRGVGHLGYKVCILFLVVCVLCLGIYTGTSGMDIAHGLFAVMIGILVSQVLLVLTNVHDWDERRKKAHAVKGFSVIVVIAGSLLLGSTVWGMMIAAVLLFCFGPKDIERFKPPKRKAKKHKRGGFASDYNHINPATGLPMVGGMNGFDVGGNMYGFDDSSHD